MDNDKGKIVKILYKATLELKTALHIGCAQVSPVGAFELMKNGNGEYIIPGTSIAGVFFDTLREVVDLDDKNFLLNRCLLLNDNIIYLVPEKKYNLIKEIDPKAKKICLTLNGKNQNFFVIIEKSDSKEEKRGENDKYKNIKKYRKSFASPLIFHSVNLGRELSLKIRNRTKLNRATKTAKEKNLFSYWEIEPENVEFDIEVEIDNLSLKNIDNDLSTLKTWVKSVFSSWQNEGVFLGANNTSGNGYCKLTNLESVEVNEKNFNDYLENKLKYIKVVNFPKDVKKRYKTWKISVKLDDEKDEYGTNALLIKGGVTHSSVVDNPVDGVFINTGKRIYIPGSSLKGAFSMVLEKYEKTDWLKKFFGQDGSEEQGYIYFPDLILAKENNYLKNHLIDIERHAEDEFTRAIYGSGKFNEERLFYEEFSGFIRIPMRFFDDHKSEIQQFNKFLRNICEKRLVSLGANGCYPEITIEEEKKDE